MKIRFYTEHMPTHGCGAIYSYNIQIGKNIVDFWKGGYGNIKSPMGSWRWYPSYEYYRKIALHIMWFSFGITFKKSWM